MTLFKELTSLAWQRFKIIAAIVGEAQSQIITTLFYFTLLVPFALIARLSPEALRPPVPRWHERPQSDNQLRDARRQG